MLKLQNHLERYSSGLRGRFAKPLVVERPARVRIPLSPPEMGHIKTYCYSHLFSNKRLTQHLPIYPISFKVTWIRTERAPTDKGGRMKGEKP